MCYRKFVEENNCNVSLNTQIFSESSVYLAMTCTIIINNSIILPGTEYCRIVGSLWLETSWRKANVYVRNTSLICLIQKSAPGNLRHGVIKEIKANARRESETRPSEIVDVVASASIIFLIRPILFRFPSFFLSFSLSQPDLIRDFKARRPRIFSQVQVRRVCGTLYFNHSGLWIDQSLSLPLSLTFDTIINMSNTDFG